MAENNQYLTPAELANLRAHLQTAVEIELSTIPIYLYTYYSINRSPSWNDSGAKLNEGSQLASFANKAGGIIMSVAVEEMLHMSLAANILRAIGGKPILYPNKSPGRYPTNLPHHKAGFKVGLSPLSANQLNLFLEIEAPEKPDAKPQPDKWETLGQFYDYIIEQIKKVNPAVFAGNANTQLQANGDYYSANNVDTIYPTDGFWVQQPNPNPYLPANATAAQAQFPNNVNSGGIRVVRSIEDAIAAMTEIKDQGEGYYVSDPSHQWDDKRNNEDSHWYKFNELLAGMLANPVVNNNLSQALFPGFTDNPTKAKWSKLTKGKSDDTIDLVNAVYAYLFLMTQVSYTLSGPAQHTLFYIGMHKGMIFILDKLIGNMRWSTNSGPKGGPYTFPNGLSPTFENYTFKSVATAKKELVALATKVYNTFPGICDSNIYERIQVLPDANVIAGEPIRF